ncbi:putative transcription regulator IWS1 family [Helianthus annuus]|uniref:Putative transcription factor IIS n=1 Tax=Helianthus annuus TaxID=4232 RepID=A0A251VHX7_HELAN|nr:probable mediator of RNA polymerase II transcription subunit 26c [Helianthus annuus]KAF5773680.1 putative transcription regulator IWS1 family [Helianthus annuus]KAJ0481527.1 putative transcription regulator IWS1 family [Helianthus annuus]KAJ0497977.1 putative transcription regulator IWS1 family [Helianthus annuus]KAJ0663979.1 putative transcription regulator IWS1 family [Helianthus annuus]KAJ0849506.1 putative transcription regulator IWS1 family [Helianthus annuus]
MGSEFLRVKGLLDRIRETEKETRMIGEVSRIKAILNGSGYKSERVLCDLLFKLKHMVVSMKVLEVSMIGVSVTSLMNHASKDVRRTARMLVRSWRRMVGEWVVGNDNMPAVLDEECGESNKKYPPIEKPLGPTGFNVTNKIPKEPKLQHKKPLTMVVLEKQSTAMDHRKLSAAVETMKLQKPTKSVVSLTSLDKKSVEEKLEATKRKIQESYKEAEKTKRQRRIQVIEVHDVLRLGLAPKRQDNRFGKHISHRISSA